MRRTLRVGAALTAAAVIGAIGFAGAASAHVTVNPGEATQGGFTKIAFRVPNERDNASTAGLGGLVLGGLAFARTRRSA
jgi:MYXO-CTERM domain-containing protein